MRFEQYRKGARSDTFSGKIAGDLAIWPSQSELLIRGNSCLHKTLLIDRIDSSALQLNFLAMERLTDSKIVEILYRLNDYIVSTTYGTKSFRDIHMTLFTCCPADYVNECTPLDHFILYTLDHIHRLLANHDRKDFDHTHVTSQRLLIMKRDTSCDYECSVCHATVDTKYHNPPSLLTLAAVSAHKTVAIQSLSAFIRKRHVSALNLPEILSRYVFDFKLFGQREVCNFHPQNWASSCPETLCPNTQSYLHQQPDIDFNFSNAELFDRHSTIASWPKNELYLPYKDHGEHMTIAKLYAHDYSRFVHNIFSYSFLRKMTLYGQSYSLEFGNGHCCLCQDTSLIANIKNKLIPMIQKKEKYELRMSCIKSQVYVFRPQLGHSREMMFFSTNVESDIDVWPLNDPNRSTYRLSIE